MNHNGLAATSSGTTCNIIHRHRQNSTVLIKRNGTEVQISSAISVEYNRLQKTEKKMRLSFKSGGVPHRHSFTPAARIAGMVPEDASRSVTSSSSAEARAPARLLPIASQRELQIVGSILFGALTETSLTRIDTPSFHGIVSQFDGRMKFSSKTPLLSSLMDTHAAVYRILSRSNSKSRTGSVTFDGWSAALGAPVIGVSWHFVNTEWGFQSILITTLDIGHASKNGMQMCAILEEILKSSLAVGSEVIRVRTTTSDDEEATALAMDLVTNYLGSVRCVVHTLALVVNDVFTPGKEWQKLMNTVKKTTT